jgi:site-specific recombinase XerD
MKSLFHLENYRGLFRGPLQGHIDAYVALLRERGYKRYTVWPDILTIADLDAWMGREGGKVHDLNEHMVTRFMDYHMRRRTTRRRPKIAALGRLLAMLRDDGHTRPALLRKPDPAEILRLDFGRYLSETLGFAKVTVYGYTLAIRPFLSANFGRGPVDLTKLDAAMVIDYIRGYARGHGSVRSQYMVTTLRSFLRFLRATERIEADVAAVVPRVASWALAGLPSHLPRGKVNEVLACCERSTPVGKRDYAILLILARLGLRGCEVADLRLESFDWEQGRITIASRKGGRTVTMPLPGDVGRAVACYLQQARPRCACRQVFIRHQAPIVGVSVQGIRHVARNALIKAGVTGVRRGSHTFRHTLATDLLRQGAALDEIGRILRHRDPSTTAIYAKVDLSKLRTLAMRWPGGVA